MTSKRNRAQARLEHDENLCLLLASSDAEKRADAFKKLLTTYDVYHADSPPEVPSAEMIQWWGKLQRDILEIYWPLTMKTLTIDRDAYNLVIGNLQSNLPTVQRLFKGRRCELLVTSSFTFHEIETETSPEKLFYDNSFSIILKRLSDTLVDVYGLEPLDIPYFSMVAQGRN